jgi:hypothetical protein
MWRRLVTVGSGRSVYGPVCGFRIAGRLRGGTFMNLERMSVGIGSGFC